MNQWQILRKMTGKERLEQALILSDFVRDLAIQNIKENLGSKASKKAIRQALLDRVGD